MISCFEGGPMPVIEELKAEKATLEKRLKVVNAALKILDYTSTPLGPKKKFSVHTRKEMSKRRKEYWADVASGKRKRKGYKPKD
jgi:hypothetical protein